uniref:SRL_0 protein n=1 Tax=Fopius arisanus TaxID=64838 RepID=A0A0C9R7U0_9HYME
MCLTSKKLVILLLINLWVALGDDERRRKRFLFYRSNAISERACICPTEQSCSCCEDVVLLLIKTQRRLCANLMYQRNGLNVDISLDSNPVRSITITNYRPITICNQVPGSLFSRVCLSLVELNEFPRSLTVCPRFQITTKNQEWRINYTCVSISTELPTPGEPPADGANTTAGSMSGMIVASSTSSSEPGNSTGGSPPGEDAENEENGDDTMNGAVVSTGGPPGGSPGGSLGGPLGAPSGGSPGRPPGGPPGGPPGSSTDSLGGSAEALAALTALQYRVQPYGASDRSKHFPSRLPPAYAADFKHNSTSSTGVKLKSIVKTREERKTKF